MVLQESSMLNMLNMLYVSNDPTQPVKCITDKVYGHTQHLQPIHTSLELRIMNAEERAAAQVEDVQNKRPRNGVEMSFNNKVRTVYFLNIFTRWLAGLLPNLALSTANSGFIGYHC
jgi:hypothetical protein